MGDAAQPQRAEEPKRTSRIEAGAIARAHAIYTPASLSFYDFAVHGLSNRFAWRCPTSKIADLYRQQLSAKHLEAGAGTGLFLDRAARAFDRLVLLDINAHCLKVSAQRLQRFKPEAIQANLLAPSSLDLAPFTSIALTYVLHCLPGTMAEKLVVVDRLKPLMAPDATLFGATILGAAVEPNRPARVLLKLYNAKGVFNNASDDLDSLVEGLRGRFAYVDVQQCGLVALFTAH